MMNVIYLQLTSANQLITLPVPLDFSHNGGCKLFEVSGWLKPYMNDGLYLCADYVQPSILGDKLISILRKNPNNAQVSLVNQEAKEMLWLPAERSHIDEFWVYIMDSKGETPTLETCKLSCSLLFSNFKKV